MLLRVAIVSVNNVNKFFALASLVLWAVVYMYIGVPKIYSLMGGSFGLFALYPILIFAHFKFYEYRKILWLSILTLFGLIGINSVYSILAMHNIKLSTLAYILIVVIPLSWVITGYMASMEVFIEHEDFKKNKVLKNYGLYCLAVILIPLYSVLIIFSIVKFDNAVYLNGIKLLLGAIITSGIVLLLASRKISLSELELFSPKVEKKNVNINKATRYLYSGMVIVLFLSSYWEFYRHEWVLWSETATVFVLYVLFQYIFAKIIFTPKKNNDFPIDESSFPSIKSKKSIAVGLVFWVLFLSIAFLLATA